MFWRRKVDIPPHVWDLAVRRLKDTNALVPSEYVDVVDQISSGLRVASLIARDGIRQDRPLTSQEVAKTAAGLPTFHGFGKVSERAMAAMHAQGMDFLGPFAPGSPLTPFIEESPARAYDFTIGRNLEIEGRDGRVPFSVLEQLVESYDIAQACIRYIIQDMRSMPLLFKPLDETTENVDADIRAARRFWARPDGRRSWGEWIAVFLTQSLMFDAAPLYIVRNDKGKIQGLRNIDGKTIVPKIDWWGELGTGDAPAFQQVIEGVPWADYTTDQMLYPLMWPRADSVYGWPPIESVLMNANTDLRMQSFFLQFFTSGAVPELLITGPEGASIDTLQQVQSTWDAVMKGDVTRRFGGFVLPGGTGIVHTEMPTYPTELWDKIMRLTVMQFNLLPINLGFTEGVNRATAGTQMDLQERVGTFAYATWLEEFLNYVTQELLGLEVQVNLDTGRDKEDRLKEAQAWQVYINSGVVSADEVREDLTGRRIDPDNAIPRFIVAGNGVIPITQIMATSGPVDPVTMTPTTTPSPEQYVWPGEQAPNPPGKPGTPPNRPKRKLEPLPTPSEGAMVPRILPNEASPGGTQPATKSTKEFGSIILVSEGRVFFQQREGGEGLSDSAAYMWEFPGGHVDPGESRYEAAVREFAEEVGVPIPSSARLIGTVERGSWTGYVLSLPKMTDLDLTNRRPNHKDSGDPIARQWWTRWELTSRMDRREEVVEEAPEIVKFLENEPVTKEIAQFRKISETHLGNVLKGEAKPWRFTWHHQDGSALEGQVLKAAEELKSDQGKVRPTRFGAEAQAFELGMTQVIYAALQKIVDPGDVERTIQSVPFASRGLDGKLQEETTRIWAHDVANRLKLDLDPLREALDQTKEGALELGQREARDLLGLPSDSEGLVSSLVNETSIIDPWFKFDEMADTTRNVIARTLTESLMREDSPQMTAQLLSDAVGSMPRARMIAVTQTAHFMTRASLIEYTRADVEEVDLLVELTACPICRAIHEANPHPITQIGIDPPIHPNCRCALAPA